MDMFKECFHCKFRGDHQDNLPRKYLIGLVFVEDTQHADRLYGDSVNHSMVNNGNKVNKPSAEIYSLRKLCSHRVKIAIKMFISTLTCRGVLRVRTDACKWIVARSNHKTAIRPLPSTMAAWQIYEYGGIGLEHLTQSSAVRLPVITRPDEVLVEIHAAGVNPIDTVMIRELIVKLILFLI